MTTMKSACVLAVLILAVASADEPVDCGYYCAISLCAAVTAKDCNGTIIRNGGYCGCCDLCFVTLSRGERCYEPIPDMPATSACESGTSCINEICQ